MITEGHGGTVREWRPKPSRPADLWFDCLVGCAVAASMEGVTLPGLAGPDQRVRRKWRLSEVQREKVCR